MAANTLFILVDQYGNSLENFRFGGRFTFFYNYPDIAPQSVLSGQFRSGIAYGDLPKPSLGLESTTLMLNFDSDFYNAPGTLLFKGQYQAPQNITVSKKTLDPQQKNDILKRSSEDLNEAVAQRIGNIPKQL